MAELLLKVDAGSGYEDGDILCAFNARRIRCCHAEMICHPRTAPRNGSGLITLESVTHDWYESTHEYRFERVSQTEVRRVVIATGVSELFGPSVIDVPLYIRRRKLRADHRLFGVDGHEIWYGGKIDTSNQRLNAVWQAIESKTPSREINFRRWPMGQLDLRHHFPIAVQEFTDDEAVEMESGEQETLPDGSTRLVQKRLHRVDWSRRLGLSAADIAKVRDKVNIFDGRDLGQHVLAQVRTKKPSRRGQP